MCKVYFNHPAGASEKVALPLFRRWFSPCTPVSFTTYTWLDTTKPKYGRKGDKNWNSKVLQNISWRIVAKVPNNIFILQIFSKLFFCLHNFLITVQLLLAAVV